MNESNVALRTTPNELLLAAVLLSFHKIFPDRVSPALYCKSHGHPDSDSSLDLSRTVSWFTTLFPIVPPADCMGCISDAV